MGRIVRPTMPVPYPLFAPPTEAPQHEVRTLESSMLAEIWRMRGRLKDVEFENAWLKKQARRRKAKPKAKRKKP